MSDENPVFFMEVAVATAVPNLVHVHLTRGWFRLPLAGVSVVMNLEDLRAGSLTVDFWAGGSPLAGLGTSFM